MEAEEQPKTRYLQQAVTSPATGSAIPGTRERKTVRAKVTGTGAVSATVNIYGSTENAASAGVLLATLSPSGTTTGVDGVAFDAPWPYMYSDTTAVSGTGATVEVTLGV